MDSHALKAKELFLQGCNCAQAVFAAFSDTLGIDEKTAFRMASGFGGGFGRMREVCGAVSGMTLAASCLYGYDDLCDAKLKKDNYAMISGMMNSFKEELGSYICRDILKTSEAYSPTATKRSAEFYKERPCVRCVMTAADILAQTIAEKNAEEK